MKYQVDGRNNFCRVFQLPEEYPEGFCFDGGQLIPFQMVDWFNPVSGIETETKEVSHDELQESLIPFLEKKQYIKPGRKYLILCDFGAAIQFSGAAILVPGFVQTILGIEC